MNTTKSNDYETACINAAACSRTAREAYAKAKAAKEALNDANTDYDSLYYDGMIISADTSPTLTTALTHVHRAKEAFNDANTEYAVAEAIAVRAAAIAKAIAYTEADSVSNESLYT